jgi:hypothetical protein
MDSSGGADAGAREKAQEVAGQAQEKVQEAAGEAKNRVREQVDQRSTDAGQRVQATASDIRGVGDELRKQGKDQPAKVADQVAERAERLGSYLERSDGDTILRDIEDFGRRQPLAVMLGGVALGFAASRMLKASSQRRQSQRQSFSGNGQGYQRELPRNAGVPQTAGV